MGRVIIYMLLIIGSSLPVFVLYLWLRRRTTLSSDPGGGSRKGGSVPLTTLPLFLGALTAGIVSLFIAALVQRLFHLPPRTAGLGWLFFSVFVRAALVEETSRLITMFPLLKAGRIRRGRDLNIAAALGLAAGFGFAAAESALYGGMTDLTIILLRNLTSLPLHGACGIRIGAAAFLFNRQRGRAIFLYITAIIIHGAYNLIILSPATHTLMAVPVALIALVISLPLLKGSEEEQEN